MSKTVDKLIEKFKEVKEDLNKNVNASYSAGPNATTGTSGGQGGMYRSERYDAEKIEPKDKVDKMVAPAAVEMSEAKKNATAMDAMAMSEREMKISQAPWQKSVATEDHEFLKFDTNGQWSLKKSLNKVDPQENINIAHPKTKAKVMPMVGKAEGKNEESNPTKPHNKDHFKVMEMAPEKESKKEKVAGLPYNGEDKKVHKGDECHHCKTPPCKCGGAENKMRGGAVGSWASD